MSDRVPALVLQRFGIPADATIERLHVGHIHRTWLVASPAGKAVVQRLNAAVFPRPADVAQNAVVISRHLADKRSRGEYALDAPQPKKTTDGDVIALDDDGEAWRATEYVEHTRTIDIVADAAQAATAAGAFGAFAAAMADCDPGRIAVVIPHFHDLPRRLEALRQAVAADRARRVPRARDELRFCEAQQPFVDEVAAIEAELPLRVCHYDTKINNMLFDAATGRARAVIDLDTCMPGYWMYDYGDMVRTFCSPEPEDSTRIDRVRIRDDVYAALTRAFLAPLAPVIEPAERAGMACGARAICLVIGVRFLTDWLAGDRYFGVERADHNLDRARNQFALYRDLTMRFK